MNIKVDMLFHISLALNNFEYVIVNDDIRCIYNCLKKISRNIPKIKIIWKVLWNEISGAISSWQFGNQYEIFMQPSCKIHVQEC